MARTVNQCVENIIGGLGLQVAILQTQLDVAMENVEKMTMELAKLKTEKEQPVAKTTKSKKSE